ncbi:CPK4 [Symbiodinium pilosum]|uniref:non-specific serine/threonine protein kinase n=1 Tax=Symbiodinium pilosum TaxID=2952 RepID=A0A812VM90_SYMPI|nr:CPK4 [Symbiodinium pilosum]
MTATQRYFPSVSLSPTAYPPGPGPAAAQMPRLLRSEDAAAPVWKDMQQRLGRTASSVATTVPGSPPDHAASSVIATSASQSPTPSQQPARQLKPTQLLEVKVGDSPSPTPPVPVPGSPVDLPWTRLASGNLEGLGEESKADDLRRSRSRTESKAEDVPSRGSELQAAGGEAKADPSIRQEKKADARRISEDARANIRSAGEERKSDAKAIEWRGEERKADHRIAERGPPAEERREAKGRGEERKDARPKGDDARLAGMRARGEDAKPRIKARGDEAKVLDGRTRGEEARVRMRGEEVKVEARRRQTGEEAKDLKDLRRKSQEANDSPVRKPAARRVEKGKEPPGIRARAAREGEPRAEKSAEKPPEKPVKLEKQDQDPLAPPESSASAWRKWRLLQDGDETRPEDQPEASFCREMFISRRHGRPEDHYRVLGVLGKGSFGVVRKVQCRQTKAMRVMKIVDKQKALSGGYPLKLIMEEIDKLKSLDHPAVLRLFEYYADSRSLYLITDLLPGGDLLEAVEKSYAEKKQLPEAWVAAVFRQACEGVAYCHAKGVMHKDLKLENIMLCSIDPPEAVVIDVGLAELFPPSEADSFKSADAAGTLATMAPEVIRGSFCAKCDVWSLGCCLYALLCTRPRRLRDTPLPEDAKPEDDDPSCYYNYFYPFRPPLGESRTELKAYIERQRRGPDLARLRCSAVADDLVKDLLTFEEPTRPHMQAVLTHRWLQESREREQVLGAGQVDSLLQFHRTNALAQAVLLDMASQLPLAQLRELTQLFESMDKDGNGMLDRGELTEALMKAGLEGEPAKQAAVRLLDDGGGSVEFSRFVAALVPSCRELLTAKLLRSSFDRLDENGDGFVSRAELQRLLERAGSRLSHAQQQLEKKDRHVVVQQKSDRVPDSSDEDVCVSSESKRLRAAKAARKAFDGISGEGRVRVSFESLQKLLGDFTS